ncbi:MAG: TonB-dependent receptor [Opitutales bacterium]|nr:TonB-dependent receptor [Opitutales bacterium]
MNYEVKIREGRRGHCFWLSAAALCLAASSASSAVVDLPDVTVTAASRGAGAAESSPLVTTLLDADAARDAPVAALDDFLRTVPNFSLFRRTSSVAANPTTQGASLRGIGPSGASRSLVLVDGVPFNDAFGGWVYWSQIDLRAVERVEVVRGGGSTAWGNTALGGVIHIVPRRPAPGVYEAEGYFGSRSTRQAGIYGSERTERFGVSLEGRYFSTDGFTRVREDLRGAVDIPTGTRHRLANAAAEYRISDTAEMSLRGMVFRETRGNGTPLSNNETDAHRLHGKLVWADGTGAQWRGDGYYGRSDYANTFTSVSSDRNSETLVLDQYSVPSRTVGGSLRRTAEAGAAGTLTAGADARWVEGETNEFVVFQGGDRVAGGEQTLLGAFAEYDAEPDDRWRWQAGLRADYWRSADGSLTQPNGDRTDFPDRDRFVVNGRAGGTWSAVETVRLRGAVYQAFRVPTINELYRPFQVGADVTEANAALDPERLLGVEAGVDLFPAEGLSLRATAFLNEVRDPILNVTVGESPQGGQLRQRRNIGRTEIRGLELDADYAFATRWSAFAAYAVTDARVRSAPDQPALRGNRLAQVARHTATAGVRLNAGAEGAGMVLRARWNGAQFEDDLNARRLGGFLVLDASVTYRFAPGRELFAAAENLLDRRYPDGITGAGLITEGTPRMLRGGVRWAF